MEKKQEKKRVEIEALSQLIEDIETGEAVYLRLGGKSIVVSCVEVDDGDIKKCRVRRHNRP